VRITGGTWASRRFAGPARLAGIRPTPDALREQAFAVLAPELPGVVFLDLFAGTGANALEALSRGAARALLVERARPAAELIRRNLATFGVGPAVARLMVAAADRAVAELAGAGERFQLAWCDPPFDDWEAGPRALALAREHGLLPPGAWVVLELPPRREPTIAGFSAIRTLRGAVLLEVTHST
jgi:16S rRNA (guanine966-N2)-methyltransferase